MTLKVKDYKTVLEVLLVLSIFLVTSIASQFYQRQITYNNGQSFDGVFYYRVANQISKGLEIRSEGPFVYRIGTPFLAAAFFKNNLLLGFKAVNILANLLTTLLLTVWLRIYLTDWRIRTLLVALFITQWHGPIRFTYYDPTYTDPWLFVFLLTGLILIQRIKSKPSFLAIAGLGIITFLGVMFREIVLLLPISLAFITNPLSMWHDISSPMTRQNLIRMIKRPYFPFIIPLLLGITAFLIVHQLAFQTNEYAFFTTALNWAYDKPFPTYLHAYFITYGPLIILPIFAWRRSFQFLWEHQFNLVFLLGLMIIGWIGGSDTERFLYWAMPVVYVLIGLSIQENKEQLRSFGLIFVLAAGTIASQRLFWTVPDYPNAFPTPTPILSILSSRFQYLDLWSFFAERSIHQLSFLQYLLFSVGLILWLKLRSKSKYPTEPSAKA